MAERETRIPAIPPPRRRAAARALFVLILAASGCSVIESMPPEGHPLSPEYRESLELWSRKDQVVDGLQLTLGVVATLRSPEFRKAYVAETGRLYRQAPSEQEEALASELRDAAEAVEVMLSLAGPRDEWLRLDKEDSPWKVFLVDGRGERYVPSSISRITPKDVKNAMLYPYFDSWNHLFSVRFAIPAEPKGDVYGGPLRLVVTGVLGHAEVAWDALAPAA